MAKYEPCENHNDCGDCLEYQEPCEYHNDCGDCLEGVE
jgi:hypothetical protein